MVFAMISGLALMSAQNPLNIPEPTSEEIHRCFPPGTTESTPISSGSIELRAIMTCTQALVASKINLAAPLTIDPMNTLLGAESDGMTLQYNFRLDLDAAQVTDDGRTSIDSSVRSFVCGNASMRRTIARGGSYRYVWNDRAAQRVHQVLIDRCD